MRPNISAMMERRLRGADPLVSPWCFLQDWEPATEYPIGIGIWYTYCTVGPFAMALPTVRVGHSWGQPAAASWPAEDTSN